MMQLFWEFLTQGFLHILDFQGLDHLLFLSTLGVVYTYKQWKKLLWILSAFTIAHSITLALSIFNVIQFETKYVEFLIPTTILITCLENLFFPSLQRFRIGTAGVFGLIHGMGFSTLLKELFMCMDYNPWLTLVPFNLGIELAQILIIAVLLLLFQLCYKYQLITYCRVVNLVSIFIGIQALVWMYERYPF